MCESGKQCYEGEGCGSRMNQLKRLVWVLMIWVFVLTLGLGASITFQIILHQSPSESFERKANTQSQLTLYDCFGPIKSNISELPWKKKNEDGKNTSIKIEDDGHYFLFLRVTLEYRRPGVNYAVMVKMTRDSKSTGNITVGHIDERQNSTGFMGIGVLLSKNTLISVICSPAAKIDVYDTYFGLIKF